MFTVTTVPTASSDAAIHPLIGFAVDIDGECVASGELLNASWIGDETGQVITIRWEAGWAEAARAIVQAGRCRVQTRHRAASDRQHRGPRLDPGADRALRIARLQLSGRRRKASGSPTTGRSCRRRTASASVRWPRSAATHSSTSSRPARRARSTASTPTRSRRWARIAGRTPCSTIASSPETNSTGT